MDRGFAIRASASGGFYFARCRSLIERANSVVGGSGTEIWTTWKETDNSNSPWVGWARFESLPSGENAIELTAAPLTDGRIQLWSVSNSRVVYTCWKSTVASDSPFTSWEKFTDANDVRSVAVGPLSDGRLQIWLLAANGQIFTSWKQTTDQNSGWEPWVGFDRPDL